MDQQQYKPLQLADVGRGSDAGSVLEEAEQELRTLAHQLMDDAVYEDAAKLTITIDLVRQADGILLSGKCKSASPSTPTARQRSSTQVGQRSAPAHSPGFTCIKAAASNPSVACITSVCGT